MTKTDPPPKKTTSSTTTTNPTSTSIQKKLEDHATPIIAFLTAMTPHVIMFCQKAIALYKTLPEDQLQFLIGFMICFFGGVYPALFAAMEAAKHGGIHSVMSALQDLADEAMTILEASKKDDVLDQDKDGKPDVQQLDTKALLVRKAHLVVTKMNPQKINTALESIYKVWLAVMAVLAIQFARTVAFAESIRDFIQKPTKRYLVPNIIKMIPNVAYHKWVPVVSDWMIQLVAVSMAFYLTSIIVAFTSALTGALIMTRAWMKIATHKGWDLGGLIPSNHKDTLLDEISSYVIAMMGFGFQYKVGFGEVCFPFNVLLFPLGCAEQFIRWSVAR
mmetsp:Transcript_13205/g.24810  ORF Transcript_13205/g.24810 Transcript_13205/m.24810 type:complete len:332 (+) Transcript_13205:353-1348(+)